jgi:hypothetical protein
VTSFYKGGYIDTSTQTGYLETGAKKTICQNNRPFWREKYPNGSHKKADKAYATRLGFPFFLKIKFQPNQGKTCPKTGFNRPLPQSDSV